MRTIFLALLLMLPAWGAHTRAELLSDRSAVQPGSQFWVALRLEMDEHWHTYWRNPGDTGLATTVEWQLSPGLTAGELQFPAPQRLETAGLVSYGYEGEVLLLTRFTADASLKPGTPLTIQAKVKWLECKEECIPGKADLALELPVAARETASPSAEKIDRVAGGLPQPDPGVRAYKSGAQVIIEVPGATEAAFFPYEKDVITLAAPQTLQDGRLSLTPAADPKRLAGVLVRDGKAVSIDAEVGAPPTPAAAPAPEMSIGLALLAAFAGGIILNLMPCVFPVLAIKVLGFVDAANEEKGRPWVHGLVFAAGVLLSFWALAGLLLGLKAAGKAVGWGFQLQDPRFVVGMCVLFFFIGLNLLGVFEIGLGLTRLSDVSERKTGMAQSFWSGVLATLVATPCTGPFMAGALGYAASAPAIQSFLVFTSLAVGMAFPYVLLSSIPAMLRVVPRPGPWMETFKQFLGFPMLATSAGLTWVLSKQRGSDAVTTLLFGLVLLGMAAWAYGRWGNSVEARARRSGLAFATLLLLLGGSLAWQSGAAAEEKEVWQPYSEELVQRLRAEGKPVFLDFTAAWCVQCQANERLVLSDARVKEAFRGRGVELVKGDWTNYDEKITRALASFGRNGVPVYVLYRPGEEPVVLPSTLTAGIVLAELERLPAR